MGQTPLSFDVSFRTREFEVGGEVYTLREADGAAIIKYRDALVAGVTVNERGGVEKISNVYEAEFGLLCACVFKNGQPVPRGVIQSWPGRVIQRLIQELKALSGLEEKDLLRGALSSEVLSGRSPDPTS